MKRFLFGILTLLLRALAHLPLGALYLLSDLLYYPLYYVAGYRKEVVRRNLRNAFPDTSDAERRAIERGFYRHFCDYVVETVKLLHISDEEMMRRMRFTNPEMLDRLGADGQSVFMMLGHYGNWEWVTSITRWMKLVPDVPGQIYRPLKFKPADEFFLKLRSRFDTVSFAKNESPRDIIRNHREGKRMVIGFIADQTPSKNGLEYWTTFLHQDTPCFLGTEKIARKINAAVVYLDIRKVSRGHYEGTFVEITATPAATEPYAITETYMRMLEQTILRAPQYWLWSHKRWKHKRPAPEA
jgi:KDO2-lipid IV(A) lauroyltransferase